MCRLVPKSHPCDPVQFNAAPRTHHGSNLRLSRASRFIRVTRSLCSNHRTFRRNLILHTPPRMFFKILHAGVLFASIIRTWHRYTMPTASRKTRPKHNRSAYYYYHYIRTRSNTPARVSYSSTPPHPRVFSSDQRKTHRFTSPHTT